MQVAAVRTATWQRFSNAGVAQHRFDVGSHTSSCSPCSLAMQHAYCRKPYCHHEAARRKTRRLGLAAILMNGAGNVSDGSRLSIGNSEEATAFWASAFQHLTQDALSVGVPMSAIPKISSDASVDDFMAAHRHLEAILASFLSSEL